jgi:hypothetical protein
MNPAKFITSVKFIPFYKVKPLIFSLSSRIISKLNFDFL